MIIWKGYGILVIVFAVVIGKVFSSLFASMGSNSDMGMAVGLVLSAFAIWFDGNRFNAPDKAHTFIDKKSGREVMVNPDHSPFFIKMQYWAFIMGGIGLIALL